MRKLLLLLFAFGALALLAGCSPAPSTPSTPPAPTQPTHDNSAPWIELSPTQGPPGTAVEIRGFIPGGPTRAAADKDTSLQYGAICWDGCPGLKLNTVPVTWSDTDQGEFRMQFTVPAAPWLGPDGPRPLAPGEYTVGIQCVSPSPGCGLQPAQATARFQLQGPGSPLCQAGGECARLTLTPDQAAAGAEVKISGWAPLTEMFGKVASGYDLVIRPAGDGAKGGPGSQNATGSQNASGSPSATGSKASSAWSPASLGHIAQAADGTLFGSFRLPTALGDQTLNPGSYMLALASSAMSGPAKAGSAPSRIILAPTPFTIAAGLTWSELPPLIPATSQWNTSYLPSGPVAGARGRIAYCVAGAIRVTADGGKSWTQVPTTGVTAAAAASDFPLFGSGQGTPTCQDVAMDPTRPTSFYATFTAARKEYGAPPIYLTGYVTTDSGRTWKQVPAPNGFTAGNFGGFRVEETAVKALFQSEKTPLAVEATADGGVTWDQSTLNCPAGGPCVAFGPAPSGIGSCAMHDYPQPLLFSLDGGSNWSRPYWPSEVNSCNPTQLAALGGSNVALAAQWSDYPLLLSRDGGKNWSNISLPPLPDGVGNSFRQLGAQLLSDGSLLAQSRGEASAWYVLKPAAKDWCKLKSGVIPGSVRGSRAIGDRLWWIQNAPASGSGSGSGAGQGPGAGSGPATTSTVGSAPLSALQCAASGS